MQAIIVTPPRFAKEAEIGIDSYTAFGGENAQLRFTKQAPSWITAGLVVVP